MIDAIKLTAVATQAMLALPRPWFDPAHQPETPAELEERLAGVAEQIVDAAVTVDREARWGRQTGLSVVDLVALSLTKAYNESALAYEVHAGVEVPGRPSPFGDNGRARCFFQLQPSASLVPFAAWRPFEPEEWISLVGLDDEATSRCARAGVRTLAYHAWRCRKILRPNVTAGDRYWVAAVVFAEYHRPTEWASPAFCRTTTPQSLRRAHAYQTIRRKIVRGLEGPP
jgi:hypothetical protein